jgi:branched-chain amino acid transport system ATP-binding protein
VNFVVNKGEFLSLVGSNGAGKTSLVNLISAQLTPDSGRILFEGNDITATSIHQRIAAGIARSFQIVNLFDGLTVFDNIALSIFSREGKAVKMASLAEHDQDVRKEAFDVLGQFGILGKSNVLAGGLAQGERKLLDVAVAYALRPKLLFLDEPTSGVSTRDKTQIMDTVSSVVRAGTVTAVVIEHDMDVVFRYSDRIVMMHEGRFLADGTPQEIRANNEVASILLGAPLSA